MEEAPKQKSRVVAIVGRPNVGKSALFNRIAHHRIAIVNDESGVTRDRLIREVEWEGRRFSLIDTGGILVLDSSARGNAIESGIRSQVDAALADAAVIILVVDVQQGVTPMDEEVARIVRKTALPCFIAVNKCDLPQHEVGEGVFAKLGYPLFPVSAAHDRGMIPLMEAVLAKLPDVPNETMLNPLRVAVVGRPNAGKSSYINRLLNADRVIVSDVAGTTRDSIDIPFTIGTGAEARNYMLIDTAGMRNRHKVDSAVERFSLFRAEESVRQADVVVLVLDPDLGPTVEDKHIASLIEEEKKGCVILMNKWDLAMEKGITQTKALPALQKTIPFMSYCPVLFVSAKTGFNIRKSIDVIDAVAAQTRAKLPTGMLNRTLTEATHSIVSPSRGGKHFRVYYGVQLTTSPVTLRLFVNDEKLATRQYTDYLTRALRKRFGLEGAPVVVLYRARSRPDRPFVPKSGDPSRPSHRPADDDMPDEQ